VITQRRLAPSVVAFACVLGGVVSAGSVPALAHAGIHAASSCVTGGAYK
jgi:hypothetical protein